MSDARLTAIRDIIQEDVCKRGLRTDPAENLISATAGGFEIACGSADQILRRIGAQPALADVFLNDVANRRQSRVTHGSASRSRYAKRPRHSRGNSAVSVIGSLRIG